MPFYTELLLTKASRIILAINTNNNSVTLYEVLHQLNLQLLLKNPK